jgi:hypothetical protein
MLTPIQDTMPVTVTQGDADTAIPAMLSSGALSKEA